MCGGNRKDGVRWEEGLAWGEDGKLWALYLDGEFIGHLGQYPTYWFFTMHGGDNHITLPGYLTLEEAQATAAVRWRMKL